MVRQNKHKLKMKSTHKSTLTTFINWFKEAIDSHMCNDIEKMSFFGNLVQLISFPELCMECDECHDFLFYQEQCLSLYIGTSTADQVKQAIHAWGISTQTDKAMNSVRGKKLEFCRSNFSSKDKPVIYFDQNILSRAIDGKDIDIFNILTNLAGMDKYQFAYSPSHTEEIFKIKDPEDRNVFIEKIRHLTKNVSIQPTEENIELIEEDPSYPLARVEATDGSTQAVEEMKFLHTQKRRLYFPQFDTDTHKRSIANNKDIFNSLPDKDFSIIMSYCVTSRRKKDDFKNLSRHLDILNAVYSLHNALDLLGYKLEKSDRTIKSSAHDIEHLIYATQANFFITLDRTLAERAQQIYNFMEVKTEILCGSEEIYRLAGN